MKPQLFSPRFCLRALLCAALVSWGGAAFSADPPPAPPSPAQPANPAQLDSLVAPIALYPDSLVSQVLVAATYPLEVVQAAQWYAQHSSLQGKELTAAAQAQNWDPSVQALVAFPDVLKRLNDDITWTTSLGNAFLASQSDVMDAVQRLRLKAQQNGKLSSTPQEKVTVDEQGGQPVVEIQPADPAVVYVPVYNPAWIWGEPYPGYPYPYWDYPPEPYGAWFIWGPPIGLGFYFGACCGWGWGWRFGWRDHAVFVNHDFFVHAGFHAGVAGGAWSHDAAHRMGVSYPNRALAQKFHSAARPSVSAGAVQRQFNASSERMGTRQIGTAGGNRRGSAFGGMQSGRAAYTHSTRGRASMGRGGRGGHR